MAVTIDKVGGSSESKHAEIFGKSTDTKPTEDVNVNDMFIELDTGSAYFWDGTAWQVIGG
jgi:hypothetical protein